jgi:hypothetical protein
MTNRRDFEENLDDLEPRGLKQSESHEVLHAGVASEPGHPGAYNGNIPSGRPHESAPLADQPSPAGEENEDAQRMRQPGPHTGDTSEPYDNAAGHRADQYDNMGDDMGAAARAQRI